MASIEKAAGLRRGGTPTPAQLEKIHQQSRRALTAEEVYVFSLRLCDDQPDRDGERFDTAALPKLAQLMVGKTGLSDHNWQAGEQVARIFDAAVEQEGAVQFIRAWAYVLRDHQAQLISEIEGGIRREVSIGCAMGHRRCSICGAEAVQCQHVKGKYYDGQRCEVILSEPLDAYEFSFVAVPAQREAGVLKGFGGLTLEEAARSAGGGLWSDYQALQKAAGAGQAQLRRQQEELVRLGVALEMGLPRAVLERMAAALSPEDLQTVCRGWAKTLRTLYPGPVQLGAAQPTAGTDEEFCI